MSVSSAIVWPISVPFSKTVMTSLDGADPKSEMFGLLVMPSLLLTPLSGVIPVITGLPMPYPIDDESSAWPSPACSGVPFGSATMGDASVGGVVPLKLRPKA